MTDTELEARRIEELPGLGPMRPLPGDGPVVGTFVWRGDLYVCQITSGEPMVYRSIVGGWELVRPLWDDEHGNGR